MPCKRVISLHRGPVGEPRGVSFARIFREKKVYVVSSLGNRRQDFKSGGHLELW